MLFLIILGCLVPQQGHCLLFASRSGVTDQSVLEQAEADASSYEQVCRIAGLQSNKAGTGTLIKQQGRNLYILTAAHVVEQEGSIDAIFKFSNGEEVRCTGILTYVPQFGPQSPVAGLANDIAVLKCVLPKERSELNISPLAFCDASDDIETYAGTVDTSPFKKYEARVVGYGLYGRNGFPAQSDQTRRLGETFCFEVSQIDRRGENESAIISILQSLNKELYSFQAIPPVKEPSFAGPFFLTLFRKDRNDSNSYELVTNPTYDRAFPTAWLYSSLNIGRAQDMYQEYGCICAEIHPRQARIMPGDSGGPLLVECGGQYKILGIVAHQKRGDASDGKPNPLGSFYYDQFTPVKYFSDWISSICNGGLDPATTLQAITQNFHLNKWSDNTLFFTLKDNTSGQVGDLFGLYMFDKVSGRSISYDQRSQVLKIDGQSFDMRSYKTWEDARRSMMQSGLFNTLTFEKAKEWDQSALFDKLIESFRVFEDMKDAYTSSEFEMGIKSFYERYTQLREKGLEDKNLPDDMLRAFNTL